jgi:hypothetical protein
MTDSRLSADLEFVCEHACCRTPNDDTHQHLFPPAECPRCQILEATKED